MFVQKFSKSTSPNKPDLGTCVQHLCPHHGVPRNADLFIMGLRIPSWGLGLHRASVQLGQFGKASVRCVQALQVVCVGTKPPARPRCQLSSVFAGLHLVYVWKAGESRMCPSGRGYLDGEFSGTKL